MNRWTMFFGTGIFLLIIVMGCSSGGVSPVVPTTDTGLSAGSQSHGAQTQTHLWGYYNVSINIENQTAEAFLNRSVMLAANVVTFMNNNPAAMVFTINDTTVGPDYVDVDIDVGIVHPLPGMTKFNGYDVRGIFVADGAGALAYDSGLGYAQPGTDQYMLNADGYTRWWNPGEFNTPGLLGYTPGDFATKGFTGDATLNPYKYFADGLGAENDLWTFLNANANDNGVFTSGTTNTRNYYLRFPTAKSIKYGYAIVANWGGGLPENHPSNAVESIALSTYVEPKIYYVDAGNNGGDLVLDVNVFGWDYQPSTIYVESEVLGITAYEFTTEMTPVTGTDLYSTYHCDIPATSVTSSADSEFWVICEYEAYNYSNDLGVTNGAGNDILTAFFRENIEILDYNPCTLTVSNPADDFPATIPNDDTGTYTVTADVDGTIDEPFTAEFTGTTIPVPTVVDVTCDSGTGQISINGISFDGVAVGNYDLEVSNNCGAVDTVITNVLVECPTPCFTYTGARYYDGIGPDGTSGNPIPTEWDINFEATCFGVTSYEWDLDGDGTYESGVQTLPTYTGSYPSTTAPGTQNPVLRVNGAVTCTNSLELVTALYVDCYIGTPAGPGTRAAPYDQPQTANAVTSGGECIMVSSGVSSPLHYSTAAWTISNDGICVQGYNAGYGTPPWWHDWNQSEDWLTVTGDDFVIDGFEWSSYNHYSLGDYSHYNLILICGDNATISHCYFHDFGSGCVIRFLGEEAAHLDGGTVVNCLIFDAEGLEWAITDALEASYVDNIKVINNTMDYFHCYSGWYCTRSSMYIICDCPGADVRNNLATRLHGTYKYPEGPSRNEFFADTDELVVYYSDAWDISGFNVQRFLSCTEDSTCVNTGTGSDPLYMCNYTDHRLQSGSPCVNTGDPTILDYDGSLSNMGCYGGPGGDWDFED